MNIRGIKLTPAHVGHAVVYWPHRGPCEQGWITSWNVRYVFVRYAGEVDSIATHPTKLELLVES
jgi:hypothetical protein